MKHWELYDHSYTASYFYLSKLRQVLSAIATFTFAHLPIMGNGGPILMALFRATRSLARGGRVTTSSHRARGGQPGLDPQLIGSEITGAL